MVMELIPVVDLRFLTQSELATLALSSPNAYDLRRCDDVVVPKIDRSVFNESAGSRKQTYSRLRLDPPKSDCPSPSPSLSRRRGRPRSIPLRAPPSVASATPSACAQPASDDTTNDPDRRENLLITSFLRQLFSRDDRSSQALAPDKAVSSVNDKNDKWSNILAAAEVAQKALVLADDGDQETLNLKGVPVDLVALAQMEDPFGEELRSRTEGLRTEEQLLGFLSGVEGQWGSRRRRRKFVVASMFGDTLPRGWKLLLGLKRKEGIAWLDCRRYVSPNGYQFASCKEVSSYILSLQGVLKPVNDQANNTAPLSDKGALDSNAGQIHQSAISNGSSSFSSPTSVSYVSSNQERQHDGNNCYDATPISYISCENEKQHPLSSHRSAKRRRHGKAIVDGVILKDGKYICQFCHKAFTERHRYNGHIGAHVRYQGLTAETLVDESNARKATDHQSSWALVPYNLSDNGGSNMKIVAGHTAQFVPQLDDPATSRGQMEISTSKSSDGGPLEGIVEGGIAAEIKRNECVDRAFFSDSDLNADPQDCFPMVTKEPSPSKPVDDEVSEYDMIAINARVFHDRKSFDEEKPNASPDAMSLFSARPHIDGNKATDATSFSSSVSGSSSLPPVHTHEDDVSCEFNDKTDIPSPGKLENIVSLHPANVEDAVCNADEVPNSPCTSKTFDGIPLAASAADNVASTFNDRGLSSSPSKAGALEKGDYNSINYASQNVVCTSDYMDEDSNSCFDLSLSLMEMDVKAKDKHAGSNQQSGNLTSEFEKYNSNLMLEVENHSFSLSENHSSNGCEETYAEDISTHAIDEPISREGQEAGECYRPFFEKNAVLAGRMHDALQNSSVMVPFSSAKAPEIDTDINESLLQEIDKPVNELEFFFGGSNSVHEGCAADEMIADDAANEAVHISLSNSSWLQATGALPILDMLPEQCGGELGEISQKNENLQAFEDLRLGSIEPSDFALFTAPESRTVIGPSVSPGYASELEDPQCSFQLGWNISLGSIGNTSSFTSVCVWCSTEFRHEHDDDEPHSEMLGFICPPCKAKFSGR